MPAAQHYAPPTSSGQSKDRSSYQLPPSPSVRSSIKMDDEDSFYYNDIHTSSGAPSTINRLKPRPAEVDSTSTRALSRFLRVTGPDPSHTLTMQSTPSADISRNTSPTSNWTSTSPSLSKSKGPNSVDGLKNRKSFNLAVAAKESLNRFRRKRNPSNNGISSDDVFGGNWRHSDTSRSTPVIPSTPTSKRGSSASRLPAPSPIRSKSPLALSINAEVRTGYELSNISTPVVSTFSALPDSPSVISREAADTHHLYPETYTYIRRSSSFEFELEEYVPPRISIDGQLGDFRPSPVTPHFDTQSMQRSTSSLAPELPAASDPMNGRTQSYRSGDMSNSRSEHAKQDPRSHLYGFPSSGREVEPAPEVEKDEMGNSKPLPTLHIAPALPLESVPVSPSAGTSSLQPTRSSPLSPPPGIPLPLTPSSFASFPSINLPGDQAVPQHPSEADFVIRALQSQIDELVMASKTQQNQVAQLSRHLSTIFTGFHLREKWFQTKVENLEAEIEHLGLEKCALEKDKWSWEKEREGLRWLLAFGQWESRVGNTDREDGMLSALDSASNGVPLGSVSYLGSGSRQLTLFPPMGRKLRRSRTLPSLSFLANLISSHGIAEKSKDLMRDPHPSQLHPESRTHSPRADAVPSLNPSHCPPPIFSSSPAGTSIKEVLTDIPTSHSPRAVARNSSIGSRRSRPSLNVRPPVSPANSRRRVRHHSQGAGTERKLTSASGGRGSVSSSRGAFNGDAVPGGEGAIEEVPVPTHSMDGMWQLLKDLSGLLDATGKEPS